MGIFVSYDDINNALIISELAQEIEKTDFIDWGDLAVSEQQAYDLIASEVYEQYKQTENIKGERLVLLATITKLTVENFVLNLKLLKIQNGKASNE